MRLKALEETVKMQTETLGRQSDMMEKQVRFDEEVNKFLLRGEMPHATNPMENDNALTNHD